jgi:tetratricopeptide (TPR) repeat protein
MALRSCLPLLCLVCVGCQGLPALGPDSPGTAVALWEQGQAALGAGQPEKAIALYQQSLAADPAFTRNHMSMAAAYLESGNDVEACVHLGKYLEGHPEHLTVRSHYAELLVRLHRAKEGCGEFERFIADAQERGDKTLREQIHCHSRLMEVADSADDEFTAHLHRGIGLYLLARERAAVGEPDGDLPTEGLLCKAAGELSVARAQRPDEARPCWYLYAVWSRLGLQQPARKALRLASAAAPFSYLTPAEQRSLQLACRGLESEETVAAVSAGPSTP